MANEFLKVRNEGGIAWVTMNRPERLNAINAGLAFELREFFSTLDARSEARVVILQGEGRAFCAGFDLKDAQVTGRFMDAARAQALGLVSSVALQAELLLEARALAADMLAATPLGLRLTKEALGHAVDAGSMQAVVAMEDRNQILCTRGEDFEEGIAAFLDKRPPRYTGR